MVTHLIPQSFFKKTNPDYSIIMADIPGGQKSVFPVAFVLVVLFQVLILKQARGLDLRTVETTATESRKRSTSSHGFRAIDEAEFICKKTTGCPILTQSWGKITAYDPETGKSQTFRDIQAWPGGAREWNWQHHDTHHHPGMQAADVEEIRDRMEALETVDDLPMDNVLLSQGVEGNLGVQAEAKKAAISLAKDQSSLKTLKTEALIKLWNEDVKAGKKVAAVIHSTC